MQKQNDGKFKISWIIQTDESRITAGAASQITLKECKQQIFWEQ